MSDSAAGVERYRAEFQRRQRELPGHSLPWLQGLRSSALGQFRVPTRSEEEWRFTPLTPFADTWFEPADGLPRPDPGLAGLALCSWDGSRLVFVDGRYAPALSSPRAAKGVSLGSLEAELGREPESLRPQLCDAPESFKCLAALNTAFFSDGAVIRLAKDAVAPEPIHLLFLSTPSAAPRVTHPRVLILAQPGAQATVVEEYVGASAGAYFTNAFTGAWLAEGARLEHYRLQREGDAAVHAAGLRVRQGRNSVFRGHSISLGGAWARNDIHVLLDGEGAEADLSGLYVAGGAQHVDFHTAIDHLRPRGTSRELFKGVLDGSARAVFDGSIVVHPEAQKTDARVYNKNLLLSEQGAVNTKPEFKINANDVQCKHGATIGQLSPEALFYLRSRGLGREEARNLLVYAFASEMVERVRVAPLAAALAELLRARLPGG